MATQPVYRVFLLNEAGGIREAIVLAATNDTDAIAEAEGIVRRDNAELWDRARFIMRLASTLASPGACVRVEGATSSMVEQMRRPFVAIQCGRKRSADLRRSLGEEPPTTVARLAAGEAP